MSTKIKIALAATLVALTGNVALAQDFDPDLANRYPAYADPGVYGYTANGDVPTLLQRRSGATLQSAPVWLNQASANGAQSVPQHNRRIPGNQGDTSYGQDSQSWSWF